MAQAKLLLWRFMQFTVFSAGMQNSVWDFLDMTKLSTATKVSGKNQNRVQTGTCTRTNSLVSMTCLATDACNCHSEETLTNPCSHCSSSNLNRTYDPCNTEGAFCTASQSNTAFVILFSTIPQFPTGNKTRNILF